MALRESLSPIKILLELILDYYTNGTKELKENSCRDLTQLIEYTGRRKG